MRHPTTETGYALTNKYQHQLECLEMLAHAMSSDDTLLFKPHWASRLYEPVFARLGCKYRILDAKKDISTYFKHADIMVMGYLSTALWQGFYAGIPMMVLYPPSSPYDITKYKVHKFDLVPIVKDAAEIKDILRFLGRRQSWAMRYEARGGSYFLGYTYFTGNAVNNVLAYAQERSYVIYEGAKHLKEVAIALKGRGDKVLWLDKEPHPRTALWCFLNGIPYCANSNFDAFFREHSVEALFVDNETQVDTLNLIDVAESFGIKPYCVSHATLMVPDDHATESRETFCTTFVQSDFDRDNYIKRGWDEKKIIVSGIPRFNGIRGLD